MYVLSLNFQVMGIIQPIAAPGFPLIMKRRNLARRQWWVDLSQLMIEFVCAGWVCACEREGDCLTARVQNVDLLEDFTFWSGNINEGDVSGKVRRVAPPRPCRRRPRVRRRRPRVSAQGWYVRPCACACPPTRACDRARSPPRVSRRANRTAVLPLQPPPPLPPPPLLPPPPPLPPPPLQRVSRTPSPTASRRCAGSLTSPLPPLS
jgi:hypothetical protein